MIGVGAIALSAIVSSAVGFTFMSTNDQPRVASPVNILGRVLDDATQFRTMSADASVRIGRVVS